MNDLTRIAEALERIADALEADRYTSNNGTGHLAVTEMVKKA